MLATVSMLSVSQASNYVVVEFPICIDSSYQEYPAISGNIVVWHDKRNGQRLDIYGYDLSTQSEFPICTNDDSDSANPDISGNIVVWWDNRNGSCSTIYGYDLSTQSEFPICIDGPFTQYYPAISGNTVIWWENNHLYGRRLGEPNEFLIRANANNGGSADISGDTVVWTDDRNGIGNMDIYAYDLSTDTEFPICTDTNNQLSPAISDNIVVWQDKRNGSDDIYGYDLTTETEFPVSVNSGEQTEPDVSGNIILWYRGGDIYGYDLSTQSEFPVCTNESYQYQPAISGRTAVWRDDRNGGSKPDIYGAYIAVCTAPIIGDLNGDCKVNFVDFGILGNQWLQSPGTPSADIAPVGGDGIVDSLDLDLLVLEWLTCNLDPPEACWE